MTKKLIISPCGTSILTNGASSQEREILIKNANTKEGKIAQEDKHLISARIDQIEKEVKTFSLDNAKEKSAELNSLIQFYNSDLNRPQDHHILIKTDTYLGEQTAKLIGEFLKRYKIAVEILDIKDLQTKNLNSFQSALSDIVRELSERLAGYKEQDYEIIFNLTGGFKGIQGFLQVLAMFYGDKTIYIFESGSELLEIPKIPIKIDDIEVFEDNLKTFRQLSCSLPVKDISGIPSIFILQIDDEVSLSTWGEIAWRKAKNEIYRNKLYDAPLEKIRYGKGFAKDTKDLQPNRVAELNNKIDDLAKFLDQNINPKSLNFKPISKNAKLNSTHEFYANSDEAKRVYCHYEDNKLVLDEYGEHL